MFDGRSFPALHGRASLKRRRHHPLVRRPPRFPALHGRASLKPFAWSADMPSSRQFSRPSRAGLIEAPRPAAHGRAPPPCFPALHGRASLKPDVSGRVADHLARFPALHGRASLKRHLRHRDGRHRERFPALHGRASLKPGVGERQLLAGHGFSRPSRAGLIEARWRGRP